MPHKALEVVTWKEVKSEVQRCNASLYEAIQQISGVDSLKCIRAYYPFGYDIIRDGMPLLPVEDKQRVVDLHSPLVPQAVRQLLEYSWQNYPVGMLLSNHVEISFNLATHIAPVKLLKPGMLLGIHNILKTNLLSCIEHGASFVSGTNSLFMLPKISHELSNQRLAKAFALEKPLCSKTLCEQGVLLREMVHSPSFSHQWHAQLLLFSAPFMAKINAQHHVQVALLNQALQQRIIASDAMFIDLVWSLFCQQTGGSHLNMLVTETAKHMIKLIMGRLPGFVPAVDDSIAPIDQLSKIFLDIYKIRYYQPIFMRPSYYDHQTPIYYSLHKPALLYPFDSADYQSARTIALLNSVRQLLQSFQNYLSDRQCPIALQNTPLAKLLDTVEIEYFHPQGEGEINQDINSLIAQDPRFTELAVRYSLGGKLEFPIPSVFFSGCIRLRPRNVEVEKPKMREFLIPLRGMRLDDQ